MQHRLNYMLDMVRSGAWIAVTALTAFAATSVCALTISGQITNPGAYTIGQLQGLGSISETVGSNSYVGVSLWSLLGGTSSGTSNVITSGGGNNPILRNYVLAAGTDGTVSALSVGELDPLFGGTGLPYIVAYQRNGLTLAAPELIVPQDLTGTRDIINLANLSIGSVTRPPVGPGGTASQFTLSGAGAPGTFDLAALSALSATTDHNVSFFSGTTLNGPHDYTGVSLWSLLGGDSNNDQTSSLVLATGSDGFQVVFALAELNPAFGAASDLVAYSVDGALLGSSGVARLVIPGDNRGGRYVSNLASIQVQTVPEPSTMALLGIALLGSVSLDRMRRVR
jgi:hypothetical protein